jgi:hypothetical protein
MDEGDRHFGREGEVFDALPAIAGRFDELGIPYAVAGAMALDAHGFRRLTVDVDMLVTRDALRVVHDSLECLGYIPPFAGSKNFRDSEQRVRVKFLIGGEFPGNGKPNPVAFPDPSDVAIEIDGNRCLKLSTLVEMKLASGMTNPARLRDWPTFRR